jgi:hypothetical protein
VPSGRLAAAAAAARTVLPDELEDLDLILVVDRSTATEIAGITGTITSNKVSSITAGRAALALDLAEKKKTTIKVVIDNNFPRFVVQIHFEVGPGAFHPSRQTTRTSLVSCVERSVGMTGCPPTVL